jgi:hypothetical protein
MDANKLKVLQDIGFQVKKTCANCVHGKFTEWFGTCNIHTYEHLKHTGPARQLSITKDGYCPKYENDEEHMWMIHGFAELLEK